MLVYFRHVCKQYKFILGYIPSNNIGINNYSLQNFYTESYVTHFMNVFNLKSHLSF